MGNKSAAVLAVAVVMVAIVAAISVRERWSAQETLVEALAVPEPASSAQGGVTPSLPNAQRELNSNTGAMDKGKIAPEPRLDSSIGNGRELEPPKVSSLDSVSVHEVSNPVLDATVVRRPFPVSPSAQPDCVPGSGSFDCEDQQRLDEFAQETRDLVWASQVESLLKNLIDKRNPGFSIRHLQCRLTACVMEVASQESYLHLVKNLEYDEWTAAQVKPLTNRFGLENDSLGRRITVTLWFYGRIR